MLLHFIYVFNLIENLCVTQRIISKNLCGKNLTAEKNRGFAKTRKVKTAFYNTRMHLNFIKIVLKI
jgi:hypothetical protein